VSYKRIEYAAVERGYEGEVAAEDCYPARGTAEFEASLGRRSGLDVRVMVRTVVVGDWVDVAPEKKDS
jgi:hypothetical protein